MSNLSFKKISTFKGVGVHTGNDCRLTLYHSTGDGTDSITFIKNGNQLPVCHTYIRKPCERATVLTRGDFSVSTVEHLLFALHFFSGEWRVELNAPEIPILDGSALPFTSVLTKSGIAPRSKFFNVPVELEINDGVSHALIQPCAENILPTYTVDLEFPPPLGSMSYSIVPTIPAILEHLSPARTFALESEIQYLISRGLIKGGTMDCALVIGKDGPLNPEGMRFPNEPARHKILDLIGDMALLGALPRAHIRIQHPGHHLNHLIIERLSAFISKA